MVQYVEKNVQPKSKLSLGDNVRLFILDLGTWDKAKGEKKKKE
jgi:hypothetical protein